jgi:hypothetical protein
MKISKEFSPNQQSFCSEREHNFITISLPTDDNHYLRLHTLKGTNWQFFTKLHLITILHWHCTPHSLAWEFYRCSISRARVVQLLFCAAIWLTACYALNTVWVYSVRKDQQQWKFQLKCRCFKSVHIQRVIYGFSAYSKEIFLTLYPSNVVFCWERKLKLFCRRQGIEFQFIGTLISATDAPVKVKKISPTEHLQLT